MRIAVSGASGRMGRTIISILLKRGHTLAGAFEAPGSPFIGKDAGEMIGVPPLGVAVSAFSPEFLQNADGVIDFSAPSATMHLVEAVCSSKIALVIGTTGIDEAGRAKIQDASKHAAVLFSPNMSVGVNLLFKLTEMAAQALPDGYDVEVFEAHHRFKKDAPSGTAKRLVDILKNAT